MSKKPKRFGPKSKTVLAVGAVIAGAATYYLAGKDTSAPEFSRDTALAEAPNCKGPVENFENELLLSKTTQNREVVFNILDNANDECADVFEGLNSPASFRSVGGEPSRFEKIVLDTIKYRDFLPAAFAADKEGTREHFVINELLDSRTADKNKAFSINEIQKHVPVSHINAAEMPQSLEVHESVMDLPEMFEYRKENISVEEFLADTQTTSLLILKDGKIVAERYDLAGEQTTPYLVMSVSKSIISILVGMAVDEGLIEVEKPVTDYVTELKGSAYEGVAVKDILQMSSGVYWVENYTDLRSPAARMALLFASGESMKESLKSLVKSDEPGTVGSYNSADTEVLGWLVAAVTGESVSKRTQTLMESIGAENPSAWMTGQDGAEAAAGGFMATARDLAKIGELFRNDGKNIRGEQIISADWVKNSITPDKPHLEAGKDLYDYNPSNNFEAWGYGYQWWALADGTFAAVGVANQFIYINPAKNITIVKQSANPQYTSEDKTDKYRGIKGENATLAMFTAFEQEIASLGR